LFSLGWVIVTDLITSARNSYVVEARKLDQRKHRQQQGRFAIEGLQLLHMALDSGAPPLEVFYCEELFAGDEAPALLDRFRQSPADLLPVSSEVMQTLSERDTSQGIFATFALIDRPLDSLKFLGRELVIVLDRLQDPGNLGTILRTADAAGASAVILLTPCADPFDPKTVRSSMGSLFNLPVIQTGDVDRLFMWLDNNGIKPIGADAKTGKMWTHCDWRGGVALVLGNEARGLSDDVSSYIQTWASLPIKGKADSLNVAIAGGVLMYAWVQANLQL
jgi:RNA methyltransferase, TrmH family